MGLPPVVRVTVNGSGADKGGISNVRVSTLLPFPVTVKGTGGFKVVKNPGGNWVVSPDFGALANVPVLADIINKLVWFYDQADKTYKTASLQAIITALAIAADPDLQAAIAAAQAAQAAAETAQSGAETAESDASTSATAAATSASSAATSESNAATSETNSAASASAASSSASAAATSETNASASATSAASHDTAAAASATAADTAKTAAQTAQTGAEAAQTAVEALLSASKVMLILDHVPTSGDGEDGWLAVDTSTARYPVYGPKASGSWGGIVGYMIGQDGTGTGDMSKSTYDPNNVAADAFSQDNMADGTTNKNYSATDKTKLSGIEASADVTDADNVGSSIHGATGKTTPADADELALIDSAASNVLKKLTWANLKATAKSYFDTLYYIVGGTDVSVADGGTGASTASDARTNLGVAIGADVQAFDAQLSSGIPPVSAGTSNIASTDKGKLLQPSGSGQTRTIPSGLPSGFTCAFFANANSMTIAPGAGVTLIWAPSGSSGSRTLASGGLCSIIQYATDFYVISGVGLS